MIIAIDFDGTICRSKFPTIEGLQPYAKEVITELHKRGHYIIIWTCRTNDHLLDATNWLLEQGIPFHRINAGNPDNVRQYGNEGRKIYAHQYIDDKNFGGFPGWLAVREGIAQMEETFKDFAMLCQ